MKKLIIAFLGASMLLAACNKEIVKPSSDITLVERTVEDFNAIEVSDAMEVTITYSNTERKVEVEANSNVHEFVATKVVGGKLKIYRMNNVIFRRKVTMKVHVTLPELVSLDASGASEVTFTNQLEANNLEIDASGASEISGSLNAVSTTIKMSGASELNLQGASNSAIFDLSGASEFKGFDFQTNNLDAELSGASEVYVTVFNFMNLNASGASDFHYKGDCSIGELSLTGASTIRKH